jgi:hypothetical protein
VKTLPDNPNLDHLKQQAKDLLAGLRDNDPGCALADAQASLAGQYGFGSWTELKAGVDAAGARALVEGYRATAGALPELDLAVFRGAVTGLANYVSGQIHYALDAGDGEDRRYADRSVRHLLTHLPTRAALEQLVKVVTP